MEYNDFKSFIHYNELFYEEFTRVIKTIKDALWPERSNSIDVGRYVTEEYAKNEYAKNWQNIVGCIEVQMSTPSGCCGDDEYTEYIPANVVLGNGVENYINKVKADRKKAEEKKERKKKQDKIKADKDQIVREQKLLAELKEKYEGTEVEITRK